VAIIAFLAGFICGKKPVRFFWSGFAAVAAAWAILALIKSVPNHHILANRVAHLFSLPNWVPILVITSVIGGLIGGMATLSGSLLRKALQQ
jgi:hypothetical protein